MYCKDRAHEGSEDGPDEIPHMNRRPTALGAYIFAGGQTVGVSNHFDVLAHLEDGNYGVNTFRRNFPNIPVYTKVDTWPTDEFMGMVDWVYANPPCAVFSAAGKSHGSFNGWKTDPRLGCYRNCFSLLKTVRPKFLTIESVTNAYKNGKEFLRELEVEAENEGYSVTHVFVNARDCGVPQERRRHFFVAHRGRFDAQRPKRDRRTVKDVLYRIRTSGWHRPIREDLVKYLPEIGPNQGFREFWEKDNPPEKQIVDSRGFVQGRPRMMEARLPWDAAMGAFIGDFYIHPTKDRNLGVNEARALCCYPSKWKLGCPPPSAFSEFARAVLPPVADWLAQQILASLDNPPLNRPQVDHRDFIYDSLFA